MGLTQIVVDTPKSLIPQYLILRVIYAVIYLRMGISIWKYLSKWDNHDKKQTVNQQEWGYNQRRIRIGWTLYQCLYVFDLFCIFLLAYIDQHPPHHQEIARMQQIPDVQCPHSRLSIFTQIVNSK